MKKILTIPILCALSLSFSACSIMPNSTGDTKPLADLTLSDENIKKANEKKAKVAQEKVYEKVNNYIEDALDEETFKDAVYRSNNIKNPSPVEGYSVDSVMNYFDRSGKKETFNALITTKTITLVGWAPAVHHLDELQKEGAKTNGRISGDIPLNAIKIGKDSNTAEIDIGKIQFYFDKKKEYKLEEAFLKLNPKLSEKENRKVLDKTGVLKMKAIKKDGQWKFISKMTDEFSKDVQDKVLKNQKDLLAK